MNADARRSARLLELTKLVGRLAKEHKTPDEIIRAVRKRALEMASKKTADGYVEEIIRRFSN